MRRSIVIAALIAVAVLLAGRAYLVMPRLPEVATAAHFEALRADPPRLRAFLQRMPKGADLHTHLSGATYAERMIAWGVRDGLCLRRADTTLLFPPADAPADAPCGPDPDVVPLAMAVGGAGGQAAHDRLVNAFSMRWFLPTPEIPSGHDQFFSTFGRFNAANEGRDRETTLTRIAEMVVDQLRQYDADQVQYAEFMLTLLTGAERRDLAQAIVDPNADPAELRRALAERGLDTLVSRRAVDLKELTARIDALRGCGAEPSKPGCGVSYRFIAQVNRNAPPAEVFAQTATAAALVRAAPDIVAGFNFVGPEDHRTSLRDYHTHMAWIAALAGDDVPVALHAGELWLGLVPPADLAFHIREAVKTAGARRIGHGTAIAFEHDMEGLLKDMRQRGVAVEIALTSSDVILGVRGREHPLRTYLAAGVPVVLSTDDAGVSRIDLTNEYVRAAGEQGLDYRALKAISRAGISHAFLDEAEKQRQFERLDMRFTAFEQDTADAQTSFGKLKAMARAMMPSLP